MDKRRTVAYAVILAFMTVTVGHVASFIGSMEPSGWTWLGWPYALAVDASIAVCAWLTRWATTARWAWIGYFTFTFASGMLNVAQVQPAAQESPLGAWIYALFPTVAISLLGFLARDASKFRSSGKKSGQKGKVERKQPEIERVMPVQIATGGNGNRSFDDFVRAVSDEQLSPAQMTGEEIGQWARVSDSTGRRWKRKIDEKGKNE